MADGGAAWLTQDAGTRIRVSEEILARFPAFRLRLLYACGVRNRPSDATSREWLREGALRGLAALGGMRPGEHPHLRLWREAYSAFGAKPSAYPCSAESLIQRAVKGGADAVPGINCLVDAYNSVSLAHLLPIGGEDLDQLAGACVLRFATPKDGDVDAATVPDVPKPGEVIWADDLGWTCRRWNWRQGPRTRLTESTRDAYFIIEGMTPALTETELDEAARELAERIASTARPQHLQIVSVVSR
jgi:DNA/RNA-binding domain of Phe-tRNA-synthetase-like protein